jgi:hypothetical protein
MSNTSVKVAIALFLVLVSPAVSFARGGGGGVQGGGSVGMAPSGGAGARPNPATLGAMQNMQVDPSGIGNASKVAPIPPPRITVPTVPQFK